MIYDPHATGAMCAGAAHSVPKVLVHQQREGASAIAKGTEAVWNATHAVGASTADEGARLAAQQKATCRSSHPLFLLQYHQELAGLWIGLQLIGAL